MTLLVQLMQRFRRWGEISARSDVFLIGSLSTLLLVIGTTAYSWLEGWSWLDALYATIITITTVGYGDFSPQTTPGRIFAIFFTLFAISIGGYAISTFAAFTIAGRAKKIAYKQKKRRMRRIETLTDHYILCGANLLATRIAEQFTQNNVPYIIVDADEEEVRNTLLFSHPEYFKQKIKTLIDFQDTDLSHFEDRTIQELGDLIDTAYILEDPTDDYTLIQAGINRAKGLIATLPDDRDNLSIVVGARALAKRLGNENLKIMSRVEESRNMRKLYLSGADYVRLPAVMGGSEMALHITNPEIGKWWYGRQTTDENPQNVQIHQKSAAEQPLWIGKEVGAVHRDHNAMVVAVKRNGVFHSPPPHDMVIESDDIMILLSDV